MILRRKLLHWVFAAISGLITLPPTQTEKSDRLLREMVMAARAIKTLTADFETTFDFEHGETKFTRKGTLKLQKPNRVRVETDEMTLDSDGRVFWRYIKTDNTYARKVADTAMFEPDLIDALGTFGSLIFGINQAKTDFTHSYGKVRFLPNAVVAGIPCQVVELADEPNGDDTNVTTVSIGPDKLIHRFAQTISSTTHTSATIVTTLRNIQVNKPLTAADFAFAPPKTAQLEGYDKLLKEGETAPNFTLPLLEGTPCASSELRKGKKALLVNFWTYYCGPCREEFAHFQTLYTAFQNKGLEMIAINDDEPGVASTADIRKYMHDQRFTFQIGLDRDDIKNHTIAEQFGVQGYPTNYLLDSNGKVIFRSVGFDEAGLRQALKKLGLR